MKAPRTIKIAVYVLVCVLGMLPFAGVAYLVHSIDASLHRVKPIPERFQGYWIPSEEDRSWSNLLYIHIEEDRYTKAYPDGLSGLDVEVVEVSRFHEIWRADHNEGILSLYKDGHPDRNVILRQLHILYGPDEKFSFSSALKPTEWGVMPGFGKCTRYDEPPRIPSCRDPELQARLRELFPKDAQSGDRITLP